MVIGDFCANVYCIHVMMSVKITIFIIILLLDQSSESKKKIIEKLRQYDDGDGISMVLLSLQEEANGLN